MMVVAGDYSLSIYEGTEQEILPQLLVPHPGYNNTTNNHDIMLIKVGLQPPASSLPLFWSPFLSPRCSLIRLSAASPAEGSRLSEQLRLHRPAASAGSLRGRAQGVSSVRLGLHQPQLGPDPLHPPHGHAAHRLCGEVQQQPVF